MDQSLPEHEQDALLHELTEDTDVATESIVATPTPSTKKVKSPSKYRGLKIFFLSFFLLLLVLASAGGAAAYYFYGQAQSLISVARDVEAPGREAYAALKGQDLVGANAKLAETEEKFKKLQEEYGRLSWVGNLPVAGLYYKDGEHGLKAGFAGLEAAKLAVGAIEPYADVLGFKGEGSFTGGSVDNRIKLALATISKIMPVVDEMAAKLKTVEEELSYIDEKRYPESYQDKQIRSKIVEAKKVAAGASQAIVEGKPVLEVLPAVAGADGKRKKYLVIFQNDNELRPTGGFMTAYATLFVENGVVTPEKSDDIYELDKKFTGKPPIPEILKKYLKTETKWNLRDMNMSPDFKDSMDLFSSYFKKLPGEAKDIDGIIALDTAVLENLVELLGPVEVSGYGTFSAEKDKRCDCPQIIYALSEIVDRPTPYLRENRKGIIGPMMQGVIAKAYGAPKQIWPQLFEAAWKNIEGKHVQFYFYDEKAQAAAETINAAGRVRAIPEGSDYLFVVDTNLGGAKSNLFVDTKVEQDVSAPENGVIRKTVTMTYKNGFPPSNCNLEAGQLCLNGKLTDWVRIYLPKGAVIEESLGFDEGTTKQGEEFGRTIYEGVFTLQPLNQAKVKLTYTVPYTDTTNYKLYVQKQAGAEAIPTLMRVNEGEHEVVLDKDLTVSFPF